MRAAAVFSINSSRTGMRRCNLGVHRWRLWKRNRNGRPGGHT